MHNIFALIHKKTTFLTWLMQINVTNISVNLQPCILYDIHPTVMLNCTMMEFLFFSNCRYVALSVRLSSPFCKGCKIVWKNCLFTTLKCTELIVNRQEAVFCEPAVKHFLNTIETHFLNALCTSKKGSCNPNSNE